MGMYEGSERGRVEVTMLSECVAMMVPSIHVAARRARAGNAAEGNEREWRRSSKQWNGK